MALGLHGGQVSRFLFFVSISMSLTVAKILGSRNSRSLIKSMSSSSTGNISYTPTTGDDDYRKVLMTMFRAVSKPSRHLSDKEKTNNELFMQRKNFYNELCMENGPFRNSKASVIHVAGSKGKKCGRIYWGGLTKVIKSRDLHIATFTYGTRTDQNRYKADIEGRLDKNR